MKKFLLTLLPLFIIGHCYAQLVSFQQTSLPSAAKSVTLLSTIGGSGGASNSIYHNTWLVRNVTGNDWYSARLHDGISIDNSFLNPQGNTLTWWERDPNANIQSWGTSNLTYLTINNGNVGIGTTSPSYSLQIQKISTQPAFMIGGGYAGSPRLQLYGLDSDPNAWMGLGTDMAGGPYEHSIYFPTGSAGTHGKLTIGDYNGSNFNLKMSVLQNGYVGIGVGNPLAALSISNVSPVIQLFDNHYNPGDGSSFGKLAFGSSVEFASVEAGRDGNGADDVTCLRFKTSWATGAGGDGTNIERMHISANGNVGIGTTQADKKLTVNGSIHATEVLVDSSVPHPDYVFNKNYNLATLKDVKIYVDQNHHLPEIPSAAQVAKDGINLGEMNTKLLKKIEELTLYLIEKDAESEAQKKINVALQDQINQLKVLITSQSHQ